MDANEEHIRQTWEAAGWRAEKPGSISSKDPGCEYTRGLTDFFRYPSLQGNLIAHFASKPTEQTRDKTLRIACIGNSNGAESTTFRILAHQTGLDKKYKSVEIHGLDLSPTINACAALKAYPRESIEKPKKGFLRYFSPIGSGTFWKLKDELASSITIHPAQDVSAFNPEHKFDAVTALCMLIYAEDREKREETLEKLFLISRYMVVASHATEGWLQNHEALNESLIEQGFRSLNHAFERRTDTPHTLERGHSNSDNLGDLIISIKEPF